MINWANKMLQCTQTRENRASIKGHQIIKRHISKTGSVLGLGN